MADMKAHGLSNRVVLADLWAKAMASDGQALRTCFVDLAEELDASDDPTSTAPREPFHGQPRGLECCQTLVHFLDDTQRAT